VTLRYAEVVATPGNPHSGCGLNLRQGRRELSTGLAFLEPHARQVAASRLLDLDIEARATCISTRITVEDIGITLGQDVEQGDRRTRPGYALRAMIVALRRGRCREW